ncbi:MAG: hypothetical protein QT12_C0015G0008 [archaeon GW2011_AR21]|nr:MAG: hypothetical protein QT12_C0015G0008 [archaeon GW2011_AR21]HIH33353.1 hypothetical protein [Candidatus Diapherotrites archaeon]
MFGRPLGRRFMFLTPEAEARARLANERVGSSVATRSGQKFKKTLFGIIKLRQEKEASV